MLTRVHAPWAPHSFLGLPLCLRHPFVPEYGFHWSGVSLTTVLSPAEHKVGRKARPSSGLCLSGGLPQGHSPARGGHSLPGSPTHQPPDDPGVCQMSSGASAGLPQSRGAAGQQ